MKFTKFLSAALVLTLVCGANVAAFELGDGAFSVCAADVTDSGTCGENLTWTLDSEGVLTISGEGAMPMFNTYDKPWLNNRNNIKEVIISNGVASIGYGAFDNCENLKTITIPASVKWIGTGAFAACTSLESVIIPDSVEYIHWGAFQNCVNLKSITIPDSVTTIGGKAFYQCLSLKTITIPKTVTSIQRDTFGECESLESITIPDSVSNIERESFMYCENLKSITIQNPDCVIKDSEMTICNSYDNEKTQYIYNGVIRGYKGSTAEAYAKKYNRTFESLGDAPVIAFGDPNGDGAIDASDASFVLAEYAKISTGGTSELTADVKTASDANSDGSVDASDASLMLGFYAHVSTGGELDFPTYIKGGIA